MKNLILMLFTAAIIFCSTSYAQGEFSFVANNINGSDFRLPINELNTKAVRHFNHEFGFINNEIWFKIKDGFTAKFMLNDIQYRVGYDEKGNWLNMVKIYKEPAMPKDIRHMVKSKYYDYAITLVEELLVKESTTYIVHIDNAAAFKKLLLCDGEITVMEEYWK